MDLYKDGGLHVLAKINSLIDSYKTPAAGYLIFMRCWELQMLDLIHVWTDQRALGIQCMLTVSVLWKQMTEVGVPVTRGCDETSVVDRAGTARVFAIRLESGINYISKSA